MMVQPLQLLLPMELMVQSILTPPFLIQPLKKLIMDTLKPLFHTMKMEIKSLQLLKFMKLNMVRSLLPQNKTEIMRLLQLKQKMMKQEPLKLSYALAKLKSLKPQLKH